MLQDGDGDVTPRSSRDRGEGLHVSRVRPAYQQVADQLRSLIVEGTLASGDRLPSEAELGAQFGVSRSTVREALRVLASRDLTHTTRGTVGGTFVSRVRPDQVSDYLESSIGLMSGTSDMTVGELLEAREILEVPAARLAATRHSDRQLELMAEAIERERRMRGRVEKFREHRAFHTVVVEASGNALLKVVSEPLFRVLQSRFLDPDIPLAFWNRVDDAHDLILKSISDGDEDAAADAMRAHLLELRPGYLDHA